MKNKKTNCKVDLEDVMVRYSVPENLREEISARVKRINRKSTIPRSALERRSRSMQLAYVFIMQLDSTLIEEFTSLANEANKMLKHHSIYSEEYGKINKKINEFCIKTGVAKKICSSSKSYYIDYSIPIDALLAVITGFQFN